jgi:hypothetical protein
VPALLSAEITARRGRDPGELYLELVRDLGEPAASRVEGAATPPKRPGWGNSPPRAIRDSELAGNASSACSMRARQQRTHRRHQGHRGQRLVCCRDPPARRGRSQDLCKKLPR